MYAALLPIENRPRTADIDAVKKPNLTIKTPAAIMTADEISPIPVTNTTLVLDAMYQRMAADGMDDLFDPAVELPAKDMYVEFLRGRIAHYERALEQSEHERIEAERISTIIFMLAVVACTCIAVIGMGGA